MVYKNGFKDICNKTMNEDFQLNFSFIADFLNSILKAQTVNSLYIVSVFVKKTFRHTP